MPSTAIPFLRTALPLLFTLPLFVACDKPVDGKNDILTFRYDVAEQMFPAAFSTPLGNGLFIGVEVFGQAGENAPAAVLDAVSADPSVAEVVATTGNTVTIEARMSGTTEIRVTTTLGEDAFDLKTVDVTRVDLQHPGVLVSDNPPSKGLVGGTARFLAYLKDASARAAIGYGTLPITIAPSGAATVQESDEVGTSLVRFGLEGEFTITGQGDDPLTVEVVAASALTSLELKGPDTITTLRAGEVLIAVLRGLASDGSKVVGVASVAAVTTSNPTFCTIEPNPKLGEGAFTISGKAAGACRINVTLGELAVHHDLTISAQ